MTVRELMNGDESLRLGMLVFYLWPNRANGFSFSSGNSTPTTSSTICCILWKKGSLARLSLPGSLTANTKKIIIQFYYLSEWCLDQRTYSYLRWSCWWHFPSGHSEWTPHLPRGNISAWSQHLAFSWNSLWPFPSRVNCESYGIFFCLTKVPFPQNKKTKTTTKFLVATLSISNSHADLKDFRHIFLLWFLKLWNSTWACRDIYCRGMATPIYLFHSATYLLAMSDITAITVMQVFLSFGDKTRLMRKMTQSVESEKLGRKWRFLNGWYFLEGVSLRKSVGGGRDNSIIQINSNRFYRKGTTTC